MEYKFTIDGRLDGLNEYTAANRTNPHKGGDMKNKNELIITWSIRQQLKKLHIASQIHITYKFYEKNTRRDLDNIAGTAHKFIQDSLVKCGVIDNDGWKNIKGFSDEFYVDKEKPRIEVILMEVDI